MTEIPKKLPKLPPLKKKPVRFSRALCDRIFADIARGGSVSDACSGDDRPDVATLFDWLNKSDASEDPIGDPFYPLSELYNRAIVARNQVIEDMVMREACTPRLTEVYDIEYTRAYDRNNKDVFKDVEIGRKVRQMDGVDRSRLVIDTGKWLLAHLQPSRRVKNRAAAIRPTYSKDSPVTVNQGSVKDGGTGFIINIVNSPDEG